MVEQSPENTEKSLFVQTEEKILEFWKEKGIFKKTLKKDAPMGEFVFFEGPPTANGRPGIHHLEARSFKDLIPRYKTMRGFHVARRAGWDTHGLPVELEVEKKLGFKSKREIEEYGIAQFNEECKKSVWTYVDEWKEFTNRIGYWVDLEHPYVTYEPQYIESLWSIVASVYKKNLIYKDYRVVPWCPRCGTALSSHELAQGYADVKDLSVTAKFKVTNPEKLGLTGDVYILAWTTTPWTLPGNVALAVGKDIKYAYVQASNGIYILASDLVEKTFSSESVLVLKEVSGFDLVGLEYEPLYPYFKDNLPQDQQEKLKDAFKVHPADFVTTTDGTGVVHTAVMYGQDDFELGTKVGLPKFHLVDDTGHFAPFVGPFAGRFVKDEEVAVDVIKNLALRGLLFKKEKHEHSYPFCWRCKTPLLYYARDSWYISMSNLRGELLAENEKINWEPNYIKEGRFGEWLKDVKDWAISRERYWGTPLPIWSTADGSEKVVIGSMAELKEKIGARNTFFGMRHGQAQNNVENIISSKQENPHHLTPEGKKQVEVAAQELKSKKIDYIFASDFVRTKETALLVAEITGVPLEHVVFDERLREINFGDFNLHNITEARNYFTSYEERFIRRAPHGENFTEVQKRMTACIDNINTKYEGKNILIVSHEVPLWLLQSSARGMSNEAILAARNEEGNFVQNAQVVDIPYISLPRNKEGEIDLHRPYIDTVVFNSPSGKPMQRVKEVMDVWFDSGGMPFAQSHYPFENKEIVDTVGYPADYISEAIDQTRGWFYTLHAIGVLTGRGRAYKNVICLGHLLDKDGQKMSKSKGNTINPWEMIDKYGVDPLRFWMYTVNQPGESKNFDEKTVDEIVKKVFNLLSNVLNFYELYKDGDESEVVRPQSKHVLDLWILALTDELISTVSSNLDLYRPLEAGRAIREFIAEFSQWYVRRSRDRLKTDDSVEKKNAVETLRYVLHEVSKILAPFAPFFAEDMYQRVKGINGLESVHLEQWSQPTVQKEGARIVEVMAETRRIVSLALEARSLAGVKIRQPLARLSIKNETLLGHDEYIELIKDEVNVKEVVAGAGIHSDVELDTVISSDLKLEGEARELIRAIQDLRKERNLTPGQSIEISVHVNDEKKKAVLASQERIQTTCFVKKINMHDITEEAEGWIVAIL